MPNWQFDVYCLQRSLADQILASGFQLPLLRVEWHGRVPGEAMQIVAPTVGVAWFSPIELGSRVTAKHGSPGARCDECGVYRWYPLRSEEMPPYRFSPMDDDVHVAASPEWFGDGMKAFRQVIFRRELAEMIIATNPRDFLIRELSLGSPIA